MKKDLFGLAAAVSVLTLASAGALAQGAPSDVPVLGTPSGQPVAKAAAPVDAFDYSVMALSLEGKAGVVYNDNIYRSENDEESDLIGMFRPILSLDSNFAQHALGFSFAPEIGRYLSNNRNNYEDFDFKVGGRYDLTTTDALRLDGMFRRDHIEIGGFEDDPTAALVKPVVYNEKNVDLSWKGTESLFHYVAAGEWHRYDYRNVARENGTLNIQDDRDRDEYIGIGQLGYEFVPTYVFYVKGIVNQRDYDKRIDSSLLYPRDSEGYEVLIGASRDVSGIPLTFDFNLGYMNQNYDASELEDVDALAANLDARWQVSESDLLRVTLARQIKDSMLAGVSASLQTKIGAKYTHNFSETLAFDGGLAYTYSDFQSNTAISGNDRLDHIYEANLGSRYKLTESLSLDLDYNYRNRDSDALLSSYDAHSVGFSIAMEY